jgi:hypothetical protein
VLTIDWRRATPGLYAVVHEDGGTTGVIDYPNGDEPVLDRGEPIVAAFKAVYPPEVLVYDQPVIGNTITIERAISVGAGWVAIYNEAEGQPGFIIGTAPLQDGLNEAVTVELLQAAITPQLFARLHTDAGPGDDFSFPGPDQPVLYNNRLPRAAAFVTNGGPHALIRDQWAGDDNSLTVAAVVSAVPAWAAIYSDDDGQPGELLGRVWTPAGVNRQIAIPIDSPLEEGVFHLVIYEDLGEPEEFEGPEVDLALKTQANRPIRIPFSVWLPAEDS